MGKYSIHGASGIDNHRSSPGGISLGLSATDKGKFGEDRRCWADFKAFFSIIGKQKHKYMVTGIYCKQIIWPNIKAFCFMEKNGKQTVYNRNNSLNKNTW